MIWYLLIVYIVVSELLVLGFLGLGMLTKDCPGQERIEGLDRKARTLVFGVSLLLGVLLAPLAAPYLAVKSYRCIQAASKEQAYWKNIQRNHFEMSLEPIHRCNISDEVWQFLEDQSQGPLALGYRSLGEYWLKDFEPFNSKGRFLLHPDGDSIAEIAETLEIHSCEVMSFLSDGSVIVTVNCEPVDIYQQITAHGYYASFHPGFEMDQLLLLHEQHVTELVQTKNVPLQKVSDLGWKDYVHYNSRRFGQIMFELGKKDTPPEHCEFPANVVGPINCTRSLPATP